MLTCDQFIYTSEKTTEREGYQVIAKTNGVTESIINNLTGYLYPIGIDLDKFTESHSLRILDNDNIAYSIVKNIGVGYDGREGTLYTHTFVVDKTDFQKLDYDSRIFQNYFIKNTNLRGEMEKIKIEPFKIKTDFYLISRLDRASINHLLRYLFLNKKIALLDTSNLDMIQNILTLLPPSMRLISFSTNVPQPDRQPEYDLIQVPKNMVYKLDKTWKTIEPQPSQISDYVRKGSSYKDFEYLTDLITNNNEKNLLKIHDTFEKLEWKGTISKIRFSIHKDLLDSTSDVVKKGEESYECATIAQDFDFDLSSEFLNKAKRYSAEVKSEELLSKIRTSEFALQVIREPLSIRNIEVVLENVKIDDPEVRNIFLNKIIKKKKSEFKEKGYSLLEDVLFSRSYYKEDMLRLFIENKFLNPYAIQFIVDLQRTKKETDYRIIQTFVKIASLHNFQFLKKLFSVLQINLDNQKELSNLQQVMYETFSNPTFRENGSLLLIVDITKMLRVKIEKALHAKLEKESNGTLIWTSKENFEGIKHSIHDILQSMSNILKFVLNYRKQKIIPSTKSQILDEIKSIELTTNKIHSIVYTKPKPEVLLQVWLDAWLRFWGIR